MTRRRRGWIASSAIVLLLAGLLAVAAIGAAQSGVSSPDYTLDELQQGGQEITGAPPSLRYLDDSTVVYIDYKKSNPILASSASSSEWAVQNLLQQGATVDQNVLRFHYQGPRGAADREYTLRVVYWQQGQREVVRNGTAVTEPAAVNVSTESHVLEFSGAFDVAEVELRPHPDKPVRVTMWIEGQPNSARWTFKHHSLATTEVVDTTTAGSRLWWVLSNYTAWVVVLGLLAGAGCLIALRRAAAGPQMGFVSWAFWIGLGSFFVLLFGYEGVATIWVRSPIVLAGLTVAILMIPLLEGQDDRLEKWQFVRPVVTDAISAAGSEAADALKVDTSIERVTEMPDGRLAVVRPGFFKFLSRLFGGAAELRGAPELLATEVRDVGESSIDRTVWIHPLADSALEYEPEGFTPRYGWAGSTAVFAGTVLGISLIHALTGTGQVWLGSIVLLPALLEVRQGSADVWPAPAHSRPAHVTMMVGVADFKDADTLEASRRETYQEKARSSKEVEDVIELRDETLIAEALGLEVGAGIEGDRGELDELDDDGEDDDDGPSWSLPWRDDDGE